MLSSYGEYEKPKTKFQLAKAEVERQKNEKYAALLYEQEQGRIAYVAAQEKKKLEDEKAADIAAELAELKVKERKEYVAKVKADYTPELLKKEVSDMVDILAKYDKQMIKVVVDSYYRKEMDTLIDMFHIVFKDIASDDLIKQAVLTIFQVSLSQKIGDASHDLLTQD
tara:strand:+ start:7013 stop:7516 length:504 start_codon:yes stop_codon:yes gene_type:complete